MLKMPRKTKRDLNFNDFISLVNLKEIIERHIEMAKQEGWDPNDIQCSICTLTTTGKKKA